MFLGIEGMQSKYTTLQFEMHKNDTLLLYSDCLNESINSNGKEYGEDRIINMFEKSGNDSAQKIRNNIILDFAEFMWPGINKDDHTIKDFLSGKGDYHLNDDFSMLVLKRQ